MPKMKTHSGAKKRFRKTASVRAHDRGDLGAVAIGEIPALIEAAG